VRLAGWFEISLTLGVGGPHGLSEIVYAYASSAADNGSSFAGLSANTLWYNITTGLAMFFGRFAHAIPILAIAGSLAAKKEGEALRRDHAD
jgi:K+-transporting ATPase ATPase A chain